MIGRIFQIIKSIFTKRFEVVYYFELDTVLIDEKKKQDQENIRINIINGINVDLLRQGKVIEFVDLWQDMKAYVTSYTIASVKPQVQQKIMPLFYEIYAYRKLKKLENFTYKVEEQIFKVPNNEIKILKFMVEC